MRLDINLASQPYEDARQFWMRWGTAVGALGLLTLVLLALDVTGWVNARRDRQAIAEKRALIAERDVFLGINTAVSVAAILAGLVAGLLFGDLLVAPRRSL